MREEKIRLKEAEEQKKIAEEKEIELAKREAILATIRRKSKRDSDYRATVEKWGLENLADFLEDDELYKEKLKSEGESDSVRKLGRKLTYYENYVYNLPIWEDLMPYKRYILGRR